jgi:hypothetical protein
VPSERVSFFPFVFDKEHGYNILCRKVEDAGSMASSHKKPHKELDPLMPNEVDDFLSILRLTQPQPITS